MADGIKARQAAGLEDGDEEEVNARHSLKTEVRMEDRTVYHHQPEGRVYMGALGWPRAAAPPSLYQDAVKKAAMLMLPRPPR